MLQHLIQTAQPWLEHYGYAAVFGAMFLEGLGVPAPGLTFLMAAALLASRGDMRLGFVDGVALVGYAGASQLAYALGRTGGRRFLLRLKLMNRHRLRTLQSLFNRWGAPLLVAAPFVDGPRQYAALFAGAATLDWRRFARFNLGGAVVWIGFWSLATDLFGRHMNTLFAFAQRAAPWLIGSAACGLVALLVYRRFHPPAAK